MTDILIAPCGMNRSICGGYIALQNDIKRTGVRMSYCTGCSSTPDSEVDKSDIT